MAEPAKKFILNAEQRVWVEKSWGGEDWIYNGRYCGKKLHVRKGKACSWHYHRVKDEVIYCEKGRVRFTYGWEDDATSGAVIELNEDMAFHVPPGMWHRFEGLEDAVLLEFSTHHSEKDVVRAGDASREADDGEEDEEERRT